MLFRCYSGDGEAAKIASTSIGTGTRSRLRYYAGPGAYAIRLRPRPRRGSKLEAAGADGLGGLCCGGPRRSHHRLRLGRMRGVELRLLGRALDCRRRAPLAGDRLRHAVKVPGADEPLVGRRAVALALV